MITASKVALAAACEGALVLPQHHERRASSDAGNALHAELESEIGIGLVPDVLEARWPGYIWAAEVALAYDLATGTGRVIGTGIKRAYAEHLAATGQPPMGPFEIGGTADLIGIGPSGELAVVDRKSFDPRVPRAAVNAQLHTLALAACRAYGRDACEVAIWHEVRPLDVAALDVFDLDTFHGELRGILERTAAARARHRAGEALRLVPGSHCRWCAAFAGCPSQQALTTEIRSGAADVRTEALLPMGDDEAAAQAYEFLGRVQMLAKRLREALYARAAERPIPLGNGVVLGPVEKQGSEKLDGDVVYAVLREQHGQAVADAAVVRSATKTRLKEALKAVGPVAPLERAVLAEVRARGGATRETKTVIEEHVLALEAAS